MKQRSHTGAVVPAISILLAAILACNFPRSTGPETPASATTTFLVTAIAPQSAHTVSAEPLLPAGTGTAPGRDSNSGTGGNGPSISIDKDVLTSISVTDGNVTSEGQISFPGKDSSDEIYVKPVGFDSTVTSGSLIFTLTCSGRGKAKVNYKGGAIKSGSPGCGETWTVSVINGSPDSHLTIRLDDSGEIHWALTITSGN